MKKILEEKYDIYDEYDRFINLKDFIDLVVEKQNNQSHLGIEVGDELRFKVDKNGYEFTDDEFR